jgi:nicotinamide-nucleotide amidase
MSEQLSIPASILAELSRRGETLASAESLTGGMVGLLLTDVPGASISYVGGVISYATRLEAATLAELGPVAGRTAAEMARGVAQRCNADWGVATTGVAGPESQHGHPVGEVFVAVSHAADDLLRVEELLLEGGRTVIRQQAAAAALALLADALGLSSITAVVDDEGSET